MINYLYNMYKDLHVALSLNKQELESLCFTKDDLKGVPPSSSDISSVLTMATSYYARSASAMFILIKTLISFLASIFGALIYADSLSGSGIVEQVVVFFEFYALANFILLASVAGKTELLSRIIAVNTPMFKIDFENLSQEHPSVRSYLEGLDGRELLMINEVAYLDSFNNAQRNLNGL